MPETRMNFVNVEEFPTGFEPENMSVAPTKGGGEPRAKSAKEGDFEINPNPFVIQDEALLARDARAISESKQADKISKPKPVADSDIPLETDLDELTLGETDGDSEEFLRALDMALKSVRKVQDASELVEQAEGLLNQNGSLAAAATVSNPRHGRPVDLDKPDTDDGDGGGIPPIPGTMELQPKGSNGMGTFAIMTGLGSLAIAGILVLYFLKVPEPFSIFGINAASDPQPPAPALSERVDIQPINVASVLIRANPELMVKPITGISGAPIPLLAEVSPAAGRDSSLVVSGLPHGASLSAGIETSRGTWLVDSADVPNIVLFTPMGSVGSYNLKVQLVGSDGKVVDTKPLPVRLTSRDTTTASFVPVKDEDRFAANEAEAVQEDDETVTLRKGAPARNTAPTEMSPQNLGLASNSSKSEPYVGPPTNPIAAINASVIVDQADELLNRGDIATARVLYEEAANAGDAEAALKAGMTYDPLYLNAEAAGAVDPEPGRSLVWYARAIGLGARDAEPRRDALNSYIATK